MIAATLIDDEVWSSAPEDEKEAFLFIAQAARRRLDVILHGPEGTGTYSTQEWKSQYLHELSSVADGLGIKGLPRLENIGTASAGVSAFDAALAIVLTKIKVGMRDVLRTESAPLSFQTKQTIRMHIETLRSKINSSNLSEALKQTLRDKIDAVEAELDKRRSGMKPFWVLSGALAAFGAGSVSFLADLPGALKTAQSMTELVHDAHAEEERQRCYMEHPLQLPSDPQRQLTDQSGSIV